jgi:hypothetical protein
VAAFWLSGCGSEAPPPPSAPPPPAATAAAPSRPAELPQPSVLIDVLNRLSDPAIPGADKLTLVEGATDAEITTLDAFSTALRDNRMLPLTYSVTDVVWSQGRPGYVESNVTATPADPAAGAFSFPMEFKALAESAPPRWQLSRQTAELLLAFGQR